jgi:ABC-type multidrug transport system ATPase subunit
MTPLLEIAGLRRRFGDHEVIEGLDLEVEPGRKVAFVGPNGSGKSTALRCVAGTLAPTGGSVRIGGHVSGTRAARRLTGVSLSQERSFYLRISGRENLVFFARLRGFGARAAEHEVQRVGEELELGGFLDQRADEFSTGMILQLAFARSLLGDPALLLLDEPTRSLDREAVGRLWAAIDRRPRMAMLMATHMDDDVGHCDSTVTFHR